jgi:uncharacterized protein (TIGR02270 family)
MLLRLLELPAADAWQNRLAAKPQTARWAVIAAGAIGDPAIGTWLLEQMKQPELARVAGEAFSMITGVDLTYHNLDTEMPAGFESGPTDNPEDEDVAMDPDEKLSWPNCTKITDWWVKNRDRFSTGTRFLVGRPLNDEQWLEQVLKNGFQRQRAAAALELAIRRPGEPIFNVKAPGLRQKELLGS